MEPFLQALETFAGGWMPEVIFGRDMQTSTPAHRVEALPNGSILVVTWPTAADFARDEARQAQARAFAHLRPDLDFETVLRTLRERSATLAPVEPRFHPDVAPLLARVGDDVAISERQRKIAELNAWQPPEPEEWLPADAVLPPDVADSERAREHYSYLAEFLVALMHTRPLFRLAAPVKTAPAPAAHLLGGRPGPACTPRGCALTLR